MNDREFLILRNILKQLKEADGMLCLGEHLQQDVSMATPRLMATEFDDGLRLADDRRLVTSVSSERGTKYKINDAGQAWLSENKL
ncbi:MAG: hypothetical protein AAF065_11965 [Verrucomicrobiota bacterium]